MKCKHGIPSERSCTFCKSGDAKTLRRELRFGNHDAHGRLHGVQPQIGTGEIEYQHGTLSYLDDGNGSVWDADDPMNYEEDCL